MIAAYLAVMAGALLLLPAAFGNIGYVFAGFVAAAGLLPVAICAPNTPDRSQTSDGVPALRRPHAG